jgi:DNA repair protein RecN (Recombination protein N)
LQELAAHHQVICITHLPQIAARADQHFQVEKRVADNRTTTAMRPLAAADRVRVLAGMLDGDSVSGKTMDYAQELLARHQA